MLGEDCKVTCEFVYNGYVITIDTIKFQVSYVSPKGYMYLASSPDSAIRNIIKMENENA